MTGPVMYGVAWGQAGAGERWGTARSAMLTVQTSARSANRSRPCIRQVVASVSKAQWPAGERRDRVGNRVPGHWAGMSGTWACPAGRKREAGTCCPNAAPPGFRDPGRVPPNGGWPCGGQRSPPAAQQWLPAGWRSRMASPNRTCNESHSSAYPRERLPPAHRQVTA